MRAIHKLLLLALFALLPLALLAQPKAIGARLGYNMEISYQHDFCGAFLQADLGMAGFKGAMGVTGTYNWVVAGPNWMNVSTEGLWELFVGVGAGVRYGWYPYDWTAFGIAGQLGLQFTFPFQLQLGVGWRPLLGAEMWRGEEGRTLAGFHLVGLYETAFTIRYAF